MDDRGETHFWGTRGMAAAGVGLTTKGKDVAYGALERRDGGAPTMTLARRFVSADDPRAAWTSPEQVLDSILGPKPDGAAPGSPAAPPTLAAVAAALPWKTADQQKAENQALWEQMRDKALQDGFDAGREIG